MFKIFIELIQGTTNYIVKLRKGVLTQNVLPAKQKATNGQRLQWNRNLFQAMGNK